MKKTKFFYLFVIALFANVLTSCNSNKEEYNEFVLTLNQTEIAYGSNNVWTQVYNNDTNIVSQGMWFSHSATIGEGWSMWAGFVASRNSDNSDHSNDNFLSYQWSVMSQGGVSGKGTPYMVASWNTSEKAVSTISDASCAVCVGDPKNPTTFKPQSMQVNNNSYVYYTLLNGNAFSAKFKDGDWFKLNVYGVRPGGEVVGPVEFYLADYRNGKSEIIKDWTFVNLDTLGEVQYIYFTMQSSDSGQWGMNTPAYFCLDRLKIQL